MTFCQDLGTTLICQRQVVFFQQSPGQLLQNYYCKQNCAFSDVPEQPWSVNGKLSSSNNIQWRFSMPTIPSNSLENKYNIKADMWNVKWFTQIYLKHCQRHNTPKGWVLLTKHQQQNTLKYFIKLQLQDLAKTSTSKPRLNFNLVLKVWAKT